ncbi:MAG: site-2 protease family protein [Candidatus Thorarchaeota archaeon]|nr:site-2 protease family protein [Candidatus Thorarchaeota archaeon]
MEALTFFAIIIAIYLVIYIIAQAIGPDKLKERGIEAGTPFMILFKTERLNAFLTRAGKKFPRMFFNVGVVAGFLGMIFGFWMFLDNLIKFFVVPANAGGVVPIIPGVTITGLPIIYMLIGLGIALITHEFAHGLASARDDIPIKSSGLLFFLVLFGGFVEPDEEVFEKEATPQARMRLLAAGSYSNMIFAFLFLLLLVNFGALMSVGYNPPSGAYIYDIAPESPASQALEVGDVITALNGTKISTWYNVSQYMAQTTAGSTLIISTLAHGNVTITLASSEANATRGYIGIYGSDYWSPKPGWEWVPGGPMFPFHLQQIFTWTFIILFSLALFNLLPIPILDGDKLLSNALSLVTDNEHTIKMIMWPLRIISTLMILLSIGFSLLLGKGLF